MAFLENLERAVKIVGILGGLAAVGGVYIQLRDINQKDFQRRVEDWQTSAVYQILEEGRRPLTLEEIKPRYTAKANDFPEEVPRIALDSPHLMVTLIRLIQSQAVVEVSGGYAIRQEMDQAESLSQGFKLFNDQNRNMAVHNQMVLQVLSETNGPITNDQLIQKITAIGGDRSFIHDYLPMIIQQLNQQGALKVRGDGRIEMAGGLGAGRDRVVVPPQIVEIIPRIDGELLKFVLSPNNQTGYTTCYYDRNPDVVEHNPGGIVERLKKLDLVHVTDISGAKGEGGRPCTASVKVDPTDLLSQLLSYYYSVMALNFATTQ